MPRSKRDSQRPKIFIGSTVEGLIVAKLIAEELSYDFDCQLWTRFFDPGKFNMEGLESALASCPHAIIVMTPDDKSVIRGKKHSTPRDNLVFELGLFAGRYGRQAIFMVTERGKKILLPNDLLGINTAEYEVVSFDDPVAYNVTSACNKIGRIINESRRKEADLLRARPEAINFWNGLSDTVRIVYGVELAKGPGAKTHPQVSLRDLATAHLIFGFLNRAYPHKLISLFPSSTREWKTLPENEDLIFVGGFVTNEMFGYLHLQSRFEVNNNFLVKLGRICGLEGRGSKEKRVLHPLFDDGLLVAPPRSDPQAIEDFPSEEMRRDYGRVFSAKIDIYGGVRRVITFAGVKGHGTHGAARALTKDATLNRLLPTTLKGNERMELIVAADIKDDVVTQTVPVEITVNGKRIYLNGDKSLWEPCEQTNPCNECTFGIPLKHLPSTFPRVHPIQASAQLRAIVFDLDDTLVDTFGCFIVPLETVAAKRMFEVGLGPSVKDVVETLRHISMTNPDEMELMLPKRFPGTPKRNMKRALDIWEELHSSPMSLNKLREFGGRISQYKIGPLLRQMLEEMSDRYHLYLLTAGDPDFQNEKIDHLGLRDLFEHNILIVNSKSNDTKQGKMSDLLHSHDYEPGSVVVVGNRLDHEIRAGIKLGLITVWLRKGEGSAIQPGSLTGKPDCIIEDIMELDESLRSFEATRAPVLEPEEAEASGEGPLFHRR
jgi:FMN phosphatase YigB (HAD superfamily)